MDSKLKKKIALIIFLFILFITIIFNLHKIRFALDIYNIYTKEKDTDIVSESNDPKDDVAISNPLTPLIENKDDHEEIKEEESEENKPIVNKDNPVNKAETTKPYLNIINEYSVKLESLRASFESNLENLIDQGIAEYKSGQISTAKLSSNYLNSGIELEKASDKQFNALVKEMEQELKTNNYDVEIIGEIKEYYTSFKNSKKHEVISKGLKHTK